MFTRSNRTREQRKSAARGRESSKISTQTTRHATYRRAPKVRDGGTAMKLKTLRAIALTGAIALTAACSPGTDGAKGAEGGDKPAESAPADSETGADNGGEDNANEGAASGREVPEECASLTLATGETYKGKDLAYCVTAALTSYGSGMMDMSGDELQGTVQYTYTPDYSFSVEGEANGSAVKLVYNGEGIWADHGNGWIKGDTESDDYEVQMVGMVAEVYKAYANPAVTAAMIAGADTWTADAKTEVRTTPAGDKIETIRIANSEPFTWNEIEVKEFVLWYGEGWVPVSSEATSGLPGFPAATVGQEFYELGSDITIESPQ